MVKKRTIKFTRNAKNRLKWRKITESAVCSAINSPDFKEKTSKNKFNSWKKISKKYIRDTYIKEQSDIVVITAVKKKKGWG